MAQIDIMEEIMKLDVFDTHTHLIGDQLCARDFWEMAHYFWLFQELRAGGYPEHAKELPETERITAFLQAYRATRNTWMNIAFTRMMEDLYGITIHDEASIRAADAAVRAISRDKSWAQEVADKLQIRRFTVNYTEHASFHGLQLDACLIPRIDGRLNEWVKSIEQAPNRELAFVSVQEEIVKLLDEYSRMNCPGVMSTLPRYNVSALPRLEVGEQSSKDEIMMTLLHQVCSQAEKHRMVVQLFLGVERQWSQTSAAPANDPERILKLYGLFERYTCPFELVVASESNNLDVVQAAWNFANVHVGGMWWYNFRASTYKQSMQYRLEALPPNKCSLIVSDARCIEWTYGKIYLVKRTLGQFLQEQINTGWLDRETAIYAAKEWLHDSASRRYQM